ncbi:MAG: SDR family NAD(P)-dependent oxidoreductase [Brachybacterium sp.]|nr:SDR family NAD(P)-dependent oxidoreductase [Brachybacterium sp.]
MSRRRDGIATIASNAGRLPRQGMAACGASRAAAALFTQSLDLQLAEHGSRCNVVSRGTARTPMVDGMLRESSTDRSAVVAGSPATFKMQDVMDDGGVTQNR